ncbi:N-acetylglucosamine kinase [Streptomyces sp. BI20]|uniref:N-acetylglucosamine kinase n=1 Tax=Streptomyces sp. BI20 TaxID=3403460 RepID=UPI003C76374D
MGLTDPPATPPAAVLAVDAGNSKTDVALIGADGTVLGRGRSGGFQPQLVGVKPAVDTLAEAVAHAAAEAGLDPAAGPLAAHVSACLANADLPVEEEELAREIEKRGWGLRTAVLNDTFAVLRAGVDEPLGVGVVCGAGVNCAGMRPDGRTARFAALGQISGDWGGGGGLAREVLWFAARAEDGRGEPTALAGEVARTFGLGSVAEVFAALHLGELPQGRLHELVPVLFRVAADGDAVATGLVHRQADEIVAMASVALARLDLLEQPAPVVLGGSVVAARHPQLNDRIAEGLARRAPLARLSVVTARPVLGAGLLGLDAVGAPATALAHLRSQIG